MPLAHNLTFTNVSKIHGILDIIPVLKECIHAYVYLNVQMHMYHSTYVPHTYDNLLDQLIVVLSFYCRHIIHYLVTSKDVSLAVKDNE